MAIILPEGYLCTTKYGYVRKWLIENLRIVGLVELPRRIFLKSDADLRANILVAQKTSNAELKKLVKADYPIFAELVRGVGYKLGQGFSVIARRDPETGAELRDENNELIPDSDFDGVRQHFATFCRISRCWESVSKQIPTFKDWPGGRISDVTERRSLDLKPRRLSLNALRNRRAILAGDYVLLGDVAEVIEERIDLTQPPYAGRRLRLIKGLDIRAIEGLVVPQFPLRAWQIVEKEAANMYRFDQHDIIIGLVRPERRNIGILASDGDDMVGAPDGVAGIRLKADASKDYPLGWLFESLRSERVRLQLWTESGGTSYGKLTSDDIRNVLLPVPSIKDRKAAQQRFETWFGHMKLAVQAWNQIGNHDDRRPIINSPILGLESVDLEQTSCAPTRLIV